MGVKDFVTGLALPTDALFGPDGALYIADAGAVFRVASPVQSPTRGPAARDRPTDTRHGRAILRMVAGLASPRKTFGHPGLQAHELHDVRFGVASVRFHQLEPSHYNQAARKTLDMKGIAYERVRVPYQDHVDLLRTSGQDVTPYLELSNRGAGVTWDRISDWAEEQVPSPTLYPGPDTAASRAICRVIAKWAHGQVEDTIWAYVVPDAPPMFADERERWRFIEFQERRFGDLEQLRERRNHLLLGVRQQLDLAQDLVTTPGPFALGDAASAADLALYGALWPLIWAKVGFPDGYEPLSAWWERVHALG